MPGSNNNLSRRELLAGAGVGAAALLLERSGLQAQTPPGATVVFTHTTVANADAVLNDVALAVQGDRIAAIGPTDQILKTYPRADVGAKSLTIPERTLPSRRARSEMSRSPIVSSAARRPCSRRSHRSSARHESR